MPRVWRFLPHDAALVGQVSAELRVSPLMAQVLLARGLENQAADFLNSRLSALYEPELLPGLSEAADRISLSNSPILGFRNTLFTTAIRRKTRI